MAQPTYKNRLNFVVAVIYLTHKITNKGIKLNIS